MSLNDAIANLVSKLSSLPGMKEAPSAPPESANQFPFAVVYEASGNLKGLAYGTADDLATIFCEIHVSRVLLSQGITQAMAFRDPFLKALIQDPTLTNTVSTTNDIRRTFGRLEWGGIETIGYRFEVDVKVILNI